MSSEKIRNKYHCKQTELYAVVISYIISLSKHLSRFAAHNTKYTAIYITNLQAFLDAAIALPNFQQRNEPSETLRVQLDEWADVCLNRWRALRTYIEHSFKGDYLKPMLEAAGHSYLKAASAKNWEEVKELLETGSEFITTHEPVLITNGMPLDFKTNYNDDFATYKGFFNQITGSVQDQHEQTNEKIIANNDLHDAVMMIGKDAAVIFHTVAEIPIRERFIFTKVLGIVSGSGPAELKGKVTDVANNPISGVNVILETLDVEIVTDENGDYDSGNIPSGEYKLKFEKDGFVPFELGIIINKGVTKTQNAVLTAV